MKKNSIGITFKKELRSIVRDRKSLVMMLIAPIMIPVFMLLFSFVYDTIMTEKPETPETQTVWKAGVNYEMSDAEKNLASAFHLNTVYYATQDELFNAYNNKEIDAYVMKDGIQYKIFVNDMSENGAKAGTVIAEYLKSYNDYQAQIYLDSIGADSDKVFNNVEVTIEKLSGTSDLVSTIIALGFTFAIMAITLTATYGAIDATAGEKERGTLETLLTFPIKSEHLVMGKYLAITVSCLITSVLCTVLAGVSLSIASDVFAVYKNAVININAGSVLLGLLVMFAYSAFISGVCIAIAGRSKTFKEAQTALTPICFLVMIPMFLDVLDIALSVALSFAPIINHTLLLEDIFCKAEPVNVVYLLITLLTSIVYTAAVILLITKQYKSEKILFS